MLRPTQTVAIAVALLLSTGAFSACTNQQRTPEPNDKQTSPENKSGDGEESEPGARRPTMTKQSQTMQPGFDKAFASFREHAAEVLGADIAGIKGGPSYEQAGNEFKESVGQVWGFRMFHQSNPPKAVMGWATPDGAIVDTRQNLGLLFEAAGAWTDSPKLSATDLANRLAWALGTEYLVYISPQDNAPAPELLMDRAKGTGKLVFYLSHQRTGPGGAGGGPTTIYQATVTLTADRAAEFHMQPATP